MIGWSNEPRTRGAREGVLDEAPRAGVPDVDAEGTRRSPPLDEVPREGVFMLIEGEEGALRFG